MLAYLTAVYDLHRTRGLLKRSRWRSPEKSTSTIARSVLVGHASLEPDASLFAIGEDPAAFSDATLQSSATRAREDVKEDSGYQGALPVCLRKKLDGDGEF